MRFNDQAYNFNFEVKVRILKNSICLVYLFKNLNKIIINEDLRRKTNSIDLSQLLEKYFSDKIKEYEVNPEAL